MAALGVESAVSDCILFLRPQPDVRWMGRRLAIGVDSTARVLRIDVINHAKSGHHLISVSATNVRARCASIAVSSLFFSAAFFANNCFRLNTAVLIARKTHPVTSPRRKRGYRRLFLFVTLSNDNQSQINIYCQTVIQVCLYRRETPWKYWHVFKAQISHLQRPE